MRRRMSDVLRALDRNESVTILYRGKKKGVIHPAGASNDKATSVCKHPAFGMWRDRKDMQDVQKAVRRLRRGRMHAV
jgi:predicted RNA methylase